jgi:hypothetical protein
MTNPKAIACIIVKGPTIAGSNMASGTSGSTNSASWISSSATETTFRFYNFIRIIV